MRSMKVLAAMACVFGFVSQPCNAVTKEEKNDFRWALTCGALAPTEFLDLKDLGNLTMAATPPQSLPNDSRIWKKKEKEYKDYLSDRDLKDLKGGDLKTIKEILIKQHLRVIVNASYGSYKVSQITNTYQLAPAPYIYFMDIYMSHGGICDTSSYWKEREAQGDPVAREKIYGENSYGEPLETEPQQIGSFVEQQHQNETTEGIDQEQRIDALVEEGEQSAMRREIEGLADDPEAWDWMFPDPDQNRGQKIRDFIDSNVKEGIPGAIHIKLENLYWFREKAKDFIEELSSTPPSANESFNTQAAGVYLKAQFMKYGYQGLGGLLNMGYFYCNGKDSNDNDGYNMEETRCFIQPQETVRAFIMDHKIPY